MDLLWEDKKIKKLYKTTELFLSFFYTNYGDFMKVKVIDESHELDLEKSINTFLEGISELIDIKFSTSVSVFGEEQIFCFSALILYK